jgi:hypothetical protein
MLIGLILKHSSGFDWFSLPLFIAIVIGSAIARYWRFFVQWRNGKRASEWTTMPAVIDVVSISEQIEEGRHGEQTIRYLATLTYFYRNPELQMGEYSRLFTYKVEADAWSAPHKGKTVVVHIDPRNSTRSVLRKEALFDE